MGDREGETDLCVILPVYNEGLILEQLVEEIDQATQGLVKKHEIIFVNDGSTDTTPVVLDRLSAENDHVRVLHLSRNFGQQSAILAGLTYANANATVVMDSDLQDDPVAIIAMVNEWRRGAKVVYAVRVRRKDSIVYRMAFWLFYRILNWVADSPIPRDAGNFCLLDRGVVGQVVELLQSDQYLAGARRWVGFKQVGVPVERRARYDDQSRMGLPGLWRLATTAVFSFSTFPLRMFYYISFLLFLSLTVVSTVAANLLISGKEPPVWLMLVGFASLIGTINSLGIAIVGEYIARIFNKVRDRPAFIVSRISQHSNEWVSGAPRE